MAPSMTTIWRLLLVVCVALVCGGCSQKTDAPPPAATNTALPPASPRAPRALAGATSPTTIPDTGDSAVTLQQLTQALRDYVVGTRTLPRNFDEFAAKSQVQFPAPPSGKKYAIEGQAVVLVNK